MTRVALVLIVACATLTACGGSSSGPIHAERVIAEEHFPAAFTVSADGREIWYAQRSLGGIFRVDLDTGEKQRVWRVSNVVDEGEQGLVGLALHPDYPAQPYLYAYASRHLNGARNQLLKIRIENGVGVSEEVLLDVPSIKLIHQSGRLLFGPDKNLYATVGDKRDPRNATIVDDPRNVMGKVLRMTADGEVPDGNPYPGNLIWVSGIRNSFGTSFDPVNGNLWFTDNGPNCNDEVNLAAPAANYAWGSSAQCRDPGPPQNTNRDGPEPRTMPVKYYDKPMGIDGAAFCDDCGLGDDAKRTLFISAFTNGQFRKLTLDEARTGIAREDIVYDHDGAVASLETRPGQPIYFSDQTGIYKLTR